MISEEQFKIIEDYFGNKLINNNKVSIDNTEYVEMTAEEAAAYPELDNQYGVISFMNEEDENFIQTIYTLVAELAIQYEKLHTKIESEQTDYGDVIDVCFMEIL